MVRGHYNIMSKSQGCTATAVLVYLGHDYRIGYAYFSKKGTGVVGYVTFFIII